MKHLITFEKYYAYNDFKKNWGSPDEMKQEVEWIMARLLPKEDMLKSIEDLSTDKGIKFEIKLLVSPVYISVSSLMAHTAVIQRVR